MGVNSKSLFTPMLNAILVCGRSERQHMLKYAVAVLDLNPAGRFIFSLLTEVFSISSS